MAGPKEKGKIHLPTPRCVHPGPLCRGTTGTRVWLLLHLPNYGILSMLHNLLEPQFPHLGVTIIVALQGFCNS